MENVGLNIHRLADNPLELAYAREWDRLNINYDILAWIIGEGNTKGNPSERDYQIAATVIQWLGSPIGRNFVEDVLTKRN